MTLWPGRAVDGAVWDVMKAADYGQNIQQYNSRSYGVVGYHVSLTH